MLRWYFILILAVGMCHMPPSKDAKSKHSRTAAEIARMSKVTPKPGKNGIFNWPPADCGWIWKAIKYLPKAAVKPGKKTLVPTTKDRKGSLIASIAIKLAGKIIEARCIYPRESGKPKCLNKHCFDKVSSPWTWANQLQFASFATIFESKLWCYEMFWCTWCRRKECQTLWRKHAKAINWFNKTALCLRLTGDAAIALTVAETNRIKSLAA